MTCIYNNKASHINLKNWVVQDLLLHIFKKSEFGHDLNKIYPVYMFISSHYTTKNPTKKMRNSESTFNI